MTPERRFEAGNQAMQEERYEEAVRNYESLLSQGLEHPDLYYNLGNAYYRLGLMGKAVWAYEKGRQLAPRDPDIAYNLELVNARIPDRIELPDTIFLLQWYRAFKHQFTLNDLLTLGSSLLFLAGLAILLRTRIMRHRGWLTGSAAVFILLSLGIHGVALDKYWELTDQQEAIVVESEISAYPAPLEKAETVQFKLHEGTKVEIRQTQPGWVEIILLDGKKGWVRTHSVMML
ncbi:MAG: tetratricopeptide repeat protein [Fidelibacterota bacterium]